MRLRAVDSGARAGLSHEASLAQRMREGARLSVCDVLERLPPETAAAFFGVIDDFRIGEPLDDGASGEL